MNIGAHRRREREKKTDGTQTQQWSREFGMGKYETSAGSVCELHSGLWWRREQTYARTHTLAMRNQVF